MSIIKMIESRKHVKKLLEPLIKTTPIKEISYFEIDKDGNFYLFEPEWDVFEESLELENYFDALPATLLEKYPSSGFSFNIASNQDEKSMGKLQKFLDEMGYDLGVIYVDRSNKEEKDFFYKKITFYTEKFDKETDKLNFYINNTDILTNFFNYFSTEIKKITKNIEPETIKDNDNFYRFYTSLKKEQKNLEEELPKILVKFEKTHGLSKREKEIVYWYFMGKTSEETAKILSISFKTVEAHFANIRAKLNISKKSEIYFEIMKSNPHFFKELG